jgi:hypothetical protein
VMKLHLKSGEHVRLQHDTEGCAFRVWIENGVLHVRAMAPDEGGETCIVIAAQNVRLEQ